MKKKILIIYASYGNGHKAIGKYIERYFLEQNSNLEIKCVDLMDYAMPLIGKISQKVNSFFMLKTPFIHDMFYKSSNTVIGGYLADYISTTLFINKRMRKILADFNPDLTIATHFFGSSLISHYNHKGLINSKLVTVVTDYESCELWLNDYKCDDYLIVGDKSEVPFLVKRGIDKKKIKPLGIPIAPIVDNNFKKENLLKKLGIKGDRLVATFFGGGGNGSTASIPYIKRLMKNNLDLDIIYIAGNNKKSKEIVDNYITNNHISNVHTLGFITNVPEILQVSDFVISKPGGAQSTECLYFHKPIMMINASGGQEIANYKFFTKNGYGKRFRTSFGLTREIKNIVNNPSILKKMQNNMAKNDNKDAMAKLYKLCNDLLENNN